MSAIGRRFDGGIRPFGRFAAVLACLLVSAGCSSGPTAPLQPIPTLTLTCPPAVESESVDGDAVPISFAPPTSTGGQQPVNVTCSIAPGTPFSVGTKTVTCNATDSRGISASCQFTVRVVGPARLQFTRFLAFGDSITAGKYSDVRTLEESVFAYTRVLERLLRERYHLQTPIVINEGISGESAHLDGWRRLPVALSTYRPDVLLLMEGTNDLLAPSGVEAGVSALRDMVRQAKQQGVVVALATVPPQRSGGTRPAGVPERVPGFNDLVRALATAEGVVLVDVYDAMKDNVPTLIGVDDLHPTPRGFEVIADTFFAAIRGNYEERQPVALALRR